MITTSWYKPDQSIGRMNAQAGLTRRPEPSMKGSVATMTNPVKFLYREDAT